MTTNIPPEPDEFQTRMRTPNPPAPEEDLDATNRSGERPEPQFAPPGFGASSQAPPQPGSPTPEAAQPPAAAPFQQPQQSAGYGQTPPAGYGQPGSFASASQPAPQGGAPFAQPQQPGAPSYAPQGSGPWAPAQRAPRDANPIRAALDLSFGSYATPGIVKVVYVVGIALGALVYIGWVLSAFSFTAMVAESPFSDGGGSPLFGILVLLFGWIPVAFWILVLRVGLEMALANVRTATDVRALREQADAQKAD